MDPQQETLTEFSNGQPTFWTACPSCKLRYLYYRDIVNRALICQNCKKHFIAYEVDCQGITSEANNLLFPQNKEIPTQDHFNMNQKKVVKNFPSRVGSQGNLDNSDEEIRPFRKTSSTSEDGGDCNTEGKVYANIQSSPLQKNLPNGNAEGNNECKKNGKEAASANDNGEGSELDIEVNFRLQNKPEPKIIEVLNPDFYDFDWDKTEERFAVDQMWAIYDDLDGMPRFYARIKKVYSPGFKVQINWLDPHPEDKDEIDWYKTKLPVACGRFRHQKTDEDTVDLGMFSHRVDWEKGTTRSSYRIYPRKGETWALFKNWDIKWSLDPDNHRNYEYEFVEVLSDYSKESGVNVAYLIKIKGFISLFKPTNDNEMASFQIPPNELFKFSHRVPSFRTTGRERKDVPESYFELDPASLPGSLEETSDHVDVNMNVEIIDAKSSGSSKCLAEKDPRIPKKRRNPEEKNAIEGGNLKSAKWFPRLADACYKKKQSEKKAGYPSAKTFIGSDGENSCDASTFGKESAFTCQADADDVVVISDSDAEQIPSSTSHLDPCEIQETEFYKFEDDKSYDKFKPGQIWALYCELNSLPKYYAQIERVELSPNFKLYVRWLEACCPPKGMIQWVDMKIPICCGLFTIGEKGEFDNTAYFSHLSTGVSTGMNKYKIYPREGEVWALYRNFNSSWTSSDVQKCEYDMVEVLDVLHDRWILVLVLQQVAGFKTIFKAKRNSGHDFIMGIPWIELLRLSHKVPAFRLTEPRHGSLRGCWELDPKSMAACSVPSNLIGGVV